MRLSDRTKVARPVAHGDDDLALGDAELVELVEDHADVAVVLDHAVVVLAHH